tara:strand:+ start:670 stop:1788 length:1119 start_codon:yes stop_codon:yes gene_type:complete
MRSVLLALVCLFATGCAYDTPVYVKVDTSESAFVIQLEGKNDQGTIKSEDFLKKNMVATKRIQVSYRWISTGYMPLAGMYIPNERVIVVDRSPETREWRSGPGGTANHDQGIWVESSDSVGFSTGLSITARIASEDDAVQFLYNYPPKQQRVIGEDKMYKNKYTVDVADLADVMDKEVRTKAQAIFAYESARYTMDELRARKREVLDAVKNGTTINDPGKEPVVIEGIIEFFAKRGITITAVGMFGGFAYENPAIQKSIDAVFQAQQDEQVAIAEFDAAEERKKALKSLGEGAGDQILEKKKKEAEGIKAIADAKAYEIEKANANLETYLELKRLEIEQARLQAWDGKYPIYYLGGSQGKGLNMFLPAPRVK